MSASSATRPTMSTAARLSVIEEHIDRCGAGEAIDRVHRRIDGIGGQLATIAESLQELREAVAYMRGEQRAARGSAPDDSTPPPPRRKSRAGAVIRVSLFSAGGIAALGAVLQRLMG